MVACRLPPVLFQSHARTPEIRTPFFRSVWLWYEDIYTHDSLHMAAYRRLDIDGMELYIVEIEDDLNS